jgi:TolC family type I secretion outer membrane protein
MKKTWLLMTALAVGTFGQTQPLTLESCIRMALANNPGLKMKQLALQSSEKDVGLAVSNFLPTVGSSLGYNHQVVGPSSQMRIQNGIPVPERATSITSWSSSAGFTLEQPLFNGGYNYFNYKQSRARKESAGFSLESVKQQTIYYVKERYFNLLKARKLLVVQEETFKSSEESFKRAEALYQVGKAPKSDMLQAKYELENNRLNLLNTQNGNDVAVSSLNYILGNAIDDSIRIVDRLDTTQVDVDYAQALKAGLSNHPDILSSEADLRASRASVGMARSRFFPSISINGGYSWSNEDFKKINQMFDKDYNKYLGVSLSLPLFEGLSRIHQYAKAKIGVESQIEVLTQAQRDVAFEIKQAYLDISKFKANIEVLQNAVDVAEENLRLNKEKYKLGSGTMLDLITAQVSSTQAQSNYIQSQYDYQFAVARLEKAMGRLNP